MTTESVKHYYDIFLSSSTSDRAWNRRFATALTQHGLRVFTPDESISPGAPVEDSVRAGLSSSTSIVVVIDSSTILSPWAAFEVGAALGSGKTVVPVLASDVRGEQIPQYLRSFQAVPKEDPERAAERVVTVLKGAA
jgi:hypothetical protein